MRVEQIKSSEPRSVRFPLSQTNTQRRSAPRADDRHDPHAARCEPRRPLSAADRDAAAAQGALLRGLHPLAERGRPSAVARRFPRSRGERRPDRRRIDHLALTRAAQVVRRLLQEEPRYRHDLQHFSLDAGRYRRPTESCCNSSTPTRSWHPRSCWNFRRAVWRAMARLDRTASRRACQTWRALLHGPCDRPAHGTAGSGRSRHPAGQGSGEHAARPGRIRRTSTFIPPTFRTCSPAIGISLIAERIESENDGDRPARL